MRKRRGILVETMDWQGITLSVSYDAEYLGFARGSECAVAHLQVEAVHPQHAPLSITETGYRSHFIHPSAIDDAGGTTAFVIAWLDEAARSPAWRKRQNAAQQLSLF